MYGRQCVYLETVLANVFDVFALLIKALEIMHASILPC